MIVVLEFLLRVIILCVSILGIGVLVYLGLVLLLRPFITKRINEESGKLPEPGELWEVPGRGHPFDPPATDMTEVLEVKDGWVKHKRYVRPIGASSAVTVCKLDMFLRTFVFFKTKYEYHRIK